MTLAFPLRYLPALGLALAACAPSPADTAKAGAPLAQSIQRRDATRVRTSPVVQREMVRTLTTTTVVESDKEIELFPRTAGVVVEILAEEGDVVEQGQALAKLDDREARSALQAAQLNLRQAEEDVPRLALAVQEAQALLDRAGLAWDQARRNVERNEAAGLISQNELDQLRLTRDTSAADQVAARLALQSAQQQKETAQTAIDQAALAVEQAALTLSFTEITAPFDGVVASRSIKVGDAVSMAQAVFVLTDPFNLRAIFYRPQRELPLFQAARAPALAKEAPPLEIRIAAEALPDLEFVGRILLVSPTIDASSGSFRVTVRIEERADSPPAERLLPGMLVRLSIVTDRHPDALVVPKRALRREGDVNFVFSVAEGRARRHEVREGFASDEDVEILPREDDVLLPGTPVVVAGNRDLEDGSEVLADSILASPSELPSPQEEETVAGTGESQ